MMAALVLAAVTAANPVDLVLTAAHTNLSRQREDRFADVKLPAVVGRGFRLTLPILDSEGPWSAARLATWTYSGGTIRLHAVLAENPHPTSVLEQPAAVPVIDLSAQKVGSSSYPGENAFGVRRTVTVEKYRINALAFVERPRGEVSPYTPGMASPEVRTMMAEKGMDYWVEVKAPGAQARALSQNARLVIEGTMANLPSGLAADCYDGQGTRAQIDRPYEINRVTCWAGAKAERIAFVDISTGTVLKEWTINTTP